MLGSMHEQDANGVIAQRLADSGQNWTAASERAGVLTDGAGRPDIAIRQDGRMPVVAECEWDKPAIGDAKSRLVATLVGESRPFTHIIAVGIDLDCRAGPEDELRRRLDANEALLSVQLVSGESPEDALVWPDAPLPATPSDLAAYCEYAQAPQAAIDRHAEIIADRIMAAGDRIHAAVNQPLIRSGETFAALRRAAGASDDRQAARTACAIWLIAIDFQNDLALYSAALQERRLPSIDELKEGANGALLKSDILSAWRVIEGVNYLPVMELAIGALQAGDFGNPLSGILDDLARLSDEINAAGAKHVYNFAGELWQRLVTDREERAAHYARPAVAELLATLSAERFAHLAPDALAQISLWDAARGTGTLIGAGERALRRLHSQSGGTDPELHRKRMEERIYAMDVNGIAGTLTAKRLTDMNIAQDYSQSKMAIVSHEAGSLFLLDPSRATIADYLGGGGRGAAPGMDGRAGLFGIPPRSMDWALMNPLYSRPRKDRRQAVKGLARLRRRAAKSVGGRGYKMSNGQAGLASDFSNIANMRLAPGGVYAFALPLTAAHAESWQAWRVEIETDFQDIVAIANAGRAEQSVSADTNMNEMPVAAAKRRTRPAWRQPAAITAVNLHSAPDTMERGYAVAKEIARLPKDRISGDAARGNYFKFTPPSAGFPWFAVGNANPELTAVANALLNGKCYDPLTLSEPDLALPMTTLGKLADAGPTHHLIGHRKGNDPIGAFEWSPIADWDIVPTHASLWASEGKLQTSIAGNPTDGGRVVDKAQAANMIQFTSRCFFKRGLRWTSQSIAMAATGETARGGAVWNALQNIKAGTEPAIAVFYNSVFGAILRSAYGQSTQPGRSAIQVKAVAGLPCPDFGADTDEARRAVSVAAMAFPALSRLELQPFAYCFRDENRHRIDLAAAEMLGLVPDSAQTRAMLRHYRLPFAREPNVNDRSQRILDALDRANR